MQSAFSASEVLGAMITPAVLISASGSLVVSTSNRLTRVVDRVRNLASEAERLRKTPEDETEVRLRIIADHIPKLAARVLLLRSAMTALYLAIGLLVITSIAVGVVAALHWVHSWLPVVTGLCGASALLYASLLLVREARLAVGSTLQEMEYLEEVVAKGGAARE